MELLLTLVSATLVFGLAITLYAILTAPDEYELWENGEKEKWEDEKDD